MDNMDQLCILTLPHDAPVDCQTLNNNVVAETVSAGISIGIRWDPGGLFYGSYVGIWALCGHAGRVLCKILPVLKAY